MIEELVRFIIMNDGDGRDVRKDAFVLRGYAGTGKTSLVAALVNTMEQLEQKCVLLAPTGRAAKVFSLYANHPAFTIHKRIYRQKSIDDDSVYSLDFNPSKNTLFIIDEASMIANDSPMLEIDYGRDMIVQENHLLDDLIQYVYSGAGCRIILVGDTAQLSPVGLLQSPALQSDVINDYGLNVSCHTLTQVVRQRQQSGILLNATQLRQMITDTQTAMYFSFPKIQFCKDVRNIPGNELIEELSNCYYRYGMDETIVVCRSNKHANIYNMGIRNQILERECILETGDKIMVAKNNYFWLKKMNLPLQNPEEAQSVGTSFIANGDIATVKRSYNERELFGFHFVDCELSLPDYDDLDIEATVLLDALTSEGPALSREQNESLWTEVLKDYEDIPYKRDRIKKMKEDIYFNALQIKYAYAITCHKAQGGQWAHVFIDQGYITDEMLGEDYYRWLYTAFTRATDTVYLVNWKEN